jgi:hypothetical protein
MRIAIRDKVDRMNNKIFMRKNLAISEYFSQIKYVLTPRRQPQCGIYLLSLFLSSFVCKPGECLPPETARIARLTAR